MRLSKLSLILSLTLSSTHCFVLASDLTEDDLSSIEQVTIYGSASPISKMQYPGQISIVDADQIGSLNPSSMSELLRDVPGVEFSGGPRRTGETPSIRGRGGENILILLDGARQSFISAHDGRFFLDPELVRVAEVVKGPASSLYGSGAVGGVLAFDTVNAADFLSRGENVGAKLKLGHQDANNESFVSFTGFTVTENIDLLANITSRSSGNIDLGSGATLSSEDNIETGLAKIGMQLDDAFNIDFSWQGFKNEAIEPNNGQGLNESENDVEKDIRSDNFRLGLAFTPANSTWVNASATFYKTQSEVSEYDPSLPRTTLRHIETEGFSLRNISELNIENADITFTVGVDWYKDTQRGEDSNTQTGLRGGVPNGDARFLGVFAEAAISVHNPFGLPGDLLLMPGIRYDHFKSDDHQSQTNQLDSSTSSPRFGLTYTANEQLNVFANFSEGFRAPSLNELYLDGVHFSVPHPTLFDPANGQFVFVNNNFIANTELEPEFSQSREMGMSLQFDGMMTSNDKLQTKFSYYNSDIENLIDLNVDFAYDSHCFQPPFFPCSAGTSNSQNIQSAQISGFELETFYSLDNLSVSLGYSEIQGNNKANGSDLGTLTPARLNADINWQWNNLNSDIGLRIQSARRFTRQQFNQQANTFEVAEQRSGYVVFDIYAQWQPVMVKGLQFRLGIDNVFNKDYERVYQGVFTKGRNVKLSVSYQFSS